VEKHQSFKTGKPGVGPGLPIEAERGIVLMILLLIELTLALAGKLTVIVLARKSRR
jgi:hypothetical protein